MDIKNSPINNDKSLLPGIIAYSCKEAMVMAKRVIRQGVDTVLQTALRRREREQIRAATGDSIDIIISFPSKRESDESLKITTKLHCDWHVTVESLLTNISNYETH